MINDVFANNMNAFTALEILHKKEQRGDDTFSESDLRQEQRNRNQRLKENWFFRKFLNRRIKMLNRDKVHPQLKNALLDKYIKKLKL